MNLLLFLSDLHIGAHGDLYDPSIAEERLLGLPDMLPKAAPQRLVIALGGDLIEGSDIHLTQNATIHFSAREQADLAVSLLSRMIKKIARRYYHTTLEARCIYGNHGRTSKTSHPTNNWDLEIGTRLRDLDLGFYKFVVEAHQPHSIFQLGSTRFYMIHRTKATTLDISTNAKKGVVYERLLQHNSDVLLLGHYHQGIASGDQSRKLRLVVNGALGSPEAFYREESGYWSTPCQAVIHVPETGPTTQDHVSWLRW